MARTPALISVMYRATRNRSAAFTLLELLVAVAIIVALVAVLVPSLNRARRAVQGVECLSHLRVIGKAWNEFAIANNDDVPNGGSIVTSDQWRYETLTIGGVDVWRGEVAPYEWVGMGVLVEDTLEDDRALYCPAAAWTESWDDMQRAAANDSLVGAYEPGRLGYIDYIAKSTYAQRGSAGGAPERLGTEHRTAIVADLHHREAGDLELINHRSGINTLYSDSSARLVAGPYGGEFNYWIDPATIPVTGATWADLDRGAFGSEN